MTLNNLMVRSSKAGALRCAEYPFIAIAPRSIWPGVVTPNRVLSMRKIELNCVLMLNWITWNTTIVIFKQRTYDELNCLK